MPHVYISLRRLIRSFGWINQFYDLEVSFHFFFVRDTQLRFIARLQGFPLRIESDKMYKFQRNLTEVDTVVCV